MVVLAAATFICCCVLFLIIVWRAEEQPGRFGAQTAPAKLAVPRRPLQDDNPVTKQLVLTTKARQAEAPLLEPELDHH